MDRNLWALVEVGDKLYRAVAVEVLAPDEDSRQPLVRTCRVFEGDEELNVDTVDDEALFYIYAALDDKAEKAWSEERARAAREKRRSWFRRADT